MKMTKEIKTYKVEKYVTNGEDSILGNLQYEDLKSLLKGYTYEEEMDMYFSKKGNIGYYIEEA